MGRLSGLVLALALFFMATSVMAAEALVGHYVDHTGAPIVVSLLGNGKGRIDLGQDAYFLLDGPNIWVISKYMDDDWTKTDFIARTKEALKENPGMLQKYTRVTVTDTGHMGEVAGYAGKTFEVQVAGTGETYAIILSDDKNVARLSKAIMILFQDMNQTVGNRDVVEMVGDRLKIDYGVLSLDRELTLKKIERRDYDADYFEIPAQFKK